MRSIQVGLFARVRAISAGCGLFFSLCATPAFAATPTTTTLAVGPSNNVAAGTVVTLTATVTNPAPVTKGLVLFCKANTPHCSQGVGLYGTVSLTTSGTATLKMRFGAGVTNIQAQFVATSANAASVSLTNTVAVTALPVYASVTSLAETGVMGNYTVTGAVGGFGLNSVSGTVSFLDTTNGNAQIGSANLGSNNPGWSAPVPYATGNGPSADAVGDFNGDGIPDLVEVEYNDNTVSVLLGKGDGTFGARTTYAVGVNPAQVVIGDFNRDGILDIAVANEGNDAVSVLLGNGDGTFQPQVQYSPIQGPTGIVVADFNEDGILDLAVVGNANSTVDIMMGNGDGTFQQPVAYATGRNGTAIAAGDFLGNGIQDLAVTNGTDGSVSVFLGNGDGTFQQQVAYAAGRWPNYIAVGDVNCDGTLDLVVANYTGNTVSVYLGNGDGTFQSQVTYPATGAVNLLVADINGDGYPDLAVVNYASPYTVSIYPGNGTGVFNTFTAYPSGKSPAWVAIGDFNGDGLTDLAIPNDSTSVNTSSILLGTESAPFSAGSIAVTGSAGTHNVLASFAGDAAHTGSQSNTVALTAPLGPVSVVVTSNNNPSAQGSLVTFTATLVGVGGMNPTGTVKFMDGASLLTTKAVSASAASYSTGFLAAGTHSITAVYSGNTNYVATTSAALPQVVSLITPTMSVSCSPNPVPYSAGSSAISSCVATLSGGTGTVTFNGAWTVPVVSGVATLTGFNTIGAQTLPINAVYSGDSNYNTTSASTTLAINPSTPTVALSCSPTTIIPGSSTTCTATVPAADGTVAFYSSASFTGKWWNAPFPAGGGDLAGTPVATTQDAQIDYNIIDYPWPGAIAAPSGVNSTSIYARWTGTFVSPTSAAYTIGVNSDDGANVYVNGTPIVSNLSGMQGATSNLAYTQSGQITLVAGATNTIVVEYQQNLGGAAVQLLWTPPGAINPSLLGWTVVPVNSSGQASITGGASWTHGSYSISGVYSGDSNYTSGTSNSVSVAVTLAPTVTELSSSANPITYGGSTTFTALIDTGGLAVSDTAQVAFTSNGASIGSATVSAVTTTNLLPYSQNLTGPTWTGYCGSLANMTQNTPDLMAPDGSPTAAKFVVSNSICAGPGSNGVLIGGLPGGLTAGQNYTNSVWLRGAAGGETVTFGLNDCAMISVTLTSSWKRYNATWPAIAAGTATCEGGRGFQVLGANETYYMWGAQTEQSATAGPYVATASGAATGNGGIATLTTTTLAVGSDSIVATYSGDANTLTSTSNPLIETVADATPTVAISCSPNPIMYGSGSTCTASVGGGATGTVAWSINGSYAWGTTSISSGTTTDSGFTTNGPGSYTIGAAYSGDSDNSPASASTTLTISQAPQTITFAPPASPVAYGVSPVTLTATATSGLGVNFSVLSGPGSISGNTLTITGIGTVVVAADQAGNSNFLPAPEAIGSITVNSGVTSTTLAVLPSNNVAARTLVTLTATVTNPAAVTQGVVLFCNALAVHCSQGLGLYGSVSLSTSGTAVLKMKLPVGVNNVQAIFVATNVNATSTSSTTAVTVAASPIYASSTTLGYGGVPGNYNLGGFVTAFGGQTFGSSVALLDTTNGNAQLYTAALSAPYYQYTQATYPIATRSWSSVVGDFNGDGIPDLAVATYTGNALEILLGNGDGTFQTAVPYTLTSAASSVVSGDFNGDGILDLAVANWQTNDVSVFIGVGNGTFLPQVKYGAESEPSSISVGDFNGDGILDMAVTNQVSNTVSILIGNGDGTFTPQVTYATGAGPMSVTTGDFNGDGKVDLAVANYGGTTVSVLLGKGDGTFFGQVPYTVGTAPSAVTAGDVNNDGHLDLVVANAGSNNASVLIGDGDGTFGTAVAYATGATPMSVSLGDFNNDGALDLITGNAGSDTVSLLLGTGSGTFGTQSSVAGGYSYEGLAVGDFNGDGILDFAANENNGTSVELVFLGQLREEFNVTGVSVMGSGTHNILASFPGDTIRTASQSATVPLTATKLNPVLAWGGPSGIMYGTPLSATQLNATSGGVAGTFAYTPAAGAIIPAGLQTLSVTFTPTDTTTYNSATTTVTIVVNKVTPVLTWANPTSITYGTALSAAQLNASSGGVAGTFVYTPAAGTVLGAGSHTLSVTFTPTDSADYTNQGGIVTLVVNKATLTVTPNAASRPYGAANPAFSGSITGMAAGDGITATYASGATVTTAVGVYSSGASAIASSLQDPNSRLGNYTVTQNLGTLTITQTTATIGLTSSLNPSKYGDSVTFTVTATGVAGAANPTGTVTVSDGGTTLATVTLDASGTATKSIQALTVGSHSLSGVYGGDANYK